MARITFVQPDGSKQAVDVEDGYSVMEGATANQIPGIKAECGGSCSCSTCHCYVDPAWSDRLPPMQDDEAGLVEFAWEPKETSRLMCQLMVTDEFDGLILYVPEKQL
ncbi:MAG: 2Fe-2S iron-sulfur cluster-binding protein [Acidiferrobacterales bacterium]